MKLLLVTSLVFVATFTPGHSFAPQSNVAVHISSSSSTLFSTMADSGVPPASAEASSVEDELIPTKLPSDVGMDYVPLATMLASGQLAEADQVSFTLSLCRFSYLYSHFISFIHLSLFIFLFSSPVTH